MSTYRIHRNNLFYGNRFQMVNQAVIKKICLLSVLAVGICFFRDTVFAQVVLEGEPKTLGSVRNLLIESVKDNTSLIQERERTTWNHVLEVLDENSSESIREASLGQVDYRALNKQPGAYRGRIVTVRGTLLRAQRIETGIAELMSSEPSLIDIYYECWILLPDEKTYPICACVLSLPENIRSGNNLKTEIVLDGFFYKKRTYFSDGQQYVTPVIIGKTLESVSKADSIGNSGDFNFSRSQVTTVLIIVLICLWIAFRFSRVLRRTKKVK